MAAEIAGRNTFVVCAKWSRHCATDQDVNSMLVVRWAWLRPLTKFRTFGVMFST